MKTPQQTRWLRNYHRRAQAMVRDGLTTRGTPRRRRPNGLTPEEKRTANAEKSTRRVRRRQAAGLTSRNTARKYRLAKFTPQALAYAALKAEIAASPRELPIACGFRDYDKDERFAASARKNKHALEAAERSAA